MSMQCLIIAAGRGSRLNALADSKPLIPVAGVPLIEHIVRRAVTAGATEFVVATGYRSADVAKFLDRLGRAIDVPIVTVENTQWERPNGLSVLAAAERLNDEFLLLMADHLFDPAIVRALIEGARPDARLTLAVDYRVDHPLIDLDDATKVAIGAEGRIQAIGKALSAYQAIDAGAFRTGSDLLAAIRQSLAEGRQGSLSEGVQVLADQGRAFTIDIGDTWWIDVDDPRAFHLADQHLREASPSADARPLDL